MKFREFELKKDRDAVYRILNECGWVHDKKKDKYLNDFLPKANTLVLDINGQAEVEVNSVIGRMNYLNEELKVSALIGVNASLLARKQGFSGSLTAYKMALDAQAGAEIAALCIFDQGYYNRLGFGNGNYDHIVCFTPATLNIKRKIKTPVRLTDKDFKEIHRSREKRMKCHGGITLPECTTYSEMGKPEKSVGFGFRNDKGELTHHLCIYGKGKEQGPIWINWMAYQNLNQYMDLLALLKSWEEQIVMVKMVEPPFVNMQDLIDRPFLAKSMTRKAENQNYIFASAYWQIRILDLEKCLKKTHLNCEDIEFNLHLTDPIEKYLTDESEWKGVAGDYLVKLGRNSSAVKGYDENLPTLKASVNAFSRLWYGISSASSLIYTNGIKAPEALLKQLDRAFILPEAHVDWGF